MSREAAGINRFLATFGRAIIRVSKDPRVGRGESAGPTLCGAPLIPDMEEALALTAQDLAAIRQIVADEMAKSIRRPAAVVREVRAWTAPDGEVYFGQMGLPALNTVARPGQTRRPTTASSERQSPPPHKDDGANDAEPEGSTLNFSDPGMPEN